MASNAILWLRKPNLTVRRKILLAAVTLGEVFSVEDLVVAAWKLYPESFALRGYPYPDSNRVQSKLAGHGGLRGLGWLESPEVRRLRVTLLGHRIAGILKAGIAGDTVPPQERSPEPLPLPLRDVVPEPVRSTRERVDERPARRVPRRSPIQVKHEAHAPPPAPPTDLTDADCDAVRLLARCTATRKFLRGSPLTADDAREFWGCLPSSPSDVVRVRVDATGALLERLVASFGKSSDVDPRLPPMSTSYALLNLHRFMAGRFQAFAEQPSRRSVEEA